METAPAIDAGGILYVGAQDGTLHALNVSDGTEAWNFTAGGAINGSPAIGANGVVFFGANDNLVYALE